MAALAGIVLLLLVAVAPASAADDDPPFSLAALGLKGLASFRTNVQFDTTANDDQLVVNDAIFQLEWARKLGTWGSLKLIGEARDDDFGYTRGLHFQIPETSERRSYLTLREATFSARSGPVEVTLGKQIYAWGTADFFNPTDNLNPYDYLDILEREKLAVWSASGRLSIGPTSLVFAIIPTFTPSRVPLFRSRWTPDIPGGFQAILDDRVLPDSDAGAIQYGARLRTTVKGVDVSVSYYDGFENTQAYRQTFVTVAPGVTIPRLTPVFTRIKAPGIDLSTTVGKLEVHAEAVARFVESNGRDDRFLGIAGINYTQEVGLRWLDQLTFVVEYSRETILRHIKHSGIVDKDNSPLVGDLLSDTAFRDAIMGRIQATLTQDTSLKLSGAADLAVTPSYYIQLKGLHKITDALHVEAGLDFLTGNRETFYGRWRNNDRFFLAVRYFF